MSQPVRIAIGLVLLVSGSFLAGLWVGLNYENEASQPIARPGPELDRIYEIAEGDSPALGPEGAPVTVVEFSDFQCPFCARVTPTLTRIREEYPERVRLVFKHFPLSIHPRVVDAHRAAVAADEQGMFWEMHDMLFENQDKQAPEHLRSYAEALGLDLEAFEVAVASPDVAARVDSDRAQAEDLEIQGTPAFFIGGRFLQGAHPYEVFKERVETELAAQGL